MKKLILIAIMAILCVSLVSAVDYYFVVDDGGTAADVVNVINTIMDLKDKGELAEGDYKQYSNGELSIDDFDGKVGTFVYKGEATIIVGDSKHDNFAEEVKDSLKKVGGIDAEIINVEEVESDNLIATIEEYADELEEPEENLTWPVENITQPEPELYDEPAVEPEVEPINVTIEDQKLGFFERIINWFKSLFS